MRFRKALQEEYELVYSMMASARDKSQEEHVYQWDARYPSGSMIRRDIEAGDTTLVLGDCGEVVAFFTSNSICEDDVHDDVNWLYKGDNWVILHRLCVSPRLQDSGIGQEILKAFESDAKKSYDSIRLDVFSTNARAIHIYEKFGYIRVGEAICERGPFFIYEKFL